MTNQAERSIFSREYEVNYTMAAKSLTDLSQELFGVEVAPEQRTLWDAMFPAMFYLDNLLDQDDTAEKRLATFQRSIDFLITGETNDLAVSGVEALIPLRAAVQAINPSKLPEMARQAHTIALLGERARQAKNVRTLGIISLAEGRATSRLVTPIAPSPNGDDQTEFNQYLELLSTHANALDTVFDIKQDAANGLLNFQPTIKDQVELFAMLTPGIATLLKRLDFSMFVKISKPAIKTFINRKK